MDFLLYWTYKVPYWSGYTKGQSLSLSKVHVQEPTFKMNITQVTLQGTNTLSDLIKVGPDARRPSMTKYTQDGMAQRRRRTAWPLGRTVPGFDMFWYLTRVVVRCDYASVC